MNAVKDHLRNLSRLQLFFFLFLFTWVFHLPLLGFSRSDLLPVKEQLHYQITWNGLVVGESFLSIGSSKILDKDGTNCYLLQSGAISTGIMYHLFPSSEITTSCWDPINMRTIFYTKRVTDRQGELYSHMRVDYKNGIIQGFEERITRSYPQDISSESTKENARKKLTKRKKFQENILENESINDPLSLLYLQRLLPKKLTDMYPSGKEFSVSVFSEGKKNSISLKSISGAPETLELKVNSKMQTFPVVVFQPNVNLGGIFDKRESSTIWICSDERKWPLKIETKISQGGSIIIQLYQVVGSATFSPTAEYSEDRQK